MFTRETCVMKEDFFWCTPNTSNSVALLILIVIIDEFTTLTDAFLRVYEKSGDGAKNVNFVVKNMSDFSHFFFNKRSESIGI